MKTKSIFCGLLAFFSFAFTANAQIDIDPNIGYDFKPGIYYGTRAGTTPFNPCSGKCTKICAEIKLLPGQDPILPPDSDTPQINSMSSYSSEVSSPIILWCVPEDFPEEEFQKAKAVELYKHNLRVVRGLNKNEELY